MENTVMQMRHIYKRFPGVTALCDVSVDLKEGEILSIVGENGAGKSTLMKILAGNYPSGTYEGEVLIKGKRMDAKNSLDAEKAGIAMIYQELNVELDLSVGENVLLGRWPIKKNGFIDWKRLHVEAREALQQLDVTLDTKLNARSLNASMQQLVCIARALVRKPEILILDEPTAALTQEETEHLMEVLRALQKERIACIYISHKLDEVFQISDRVITMRDGRYIRQYPKEKIVPNQVILDMVGNKLDIFKREKTEKKGAEILRAEHMKVLHPYAYHKNIIEDVSFTLHAGEILGIAGLVGAGRSELLKAVAGAMPRKGGKIFINGKETPVRSVSEAIHAGIIMLSEDRKRDGFVGTMSIKENMTLCALKRLSRRGFIDKTRENTAAEEYFNYLKVKAASIDTGITTLSGGNQQKVILAKALLSKANILFLDEPTRGIDIGAKAEIYKIMKDLTEKGMGIIVISSELPELISICDRLLVLRRGYISAEMAAEYVTQQDILHAAAFGKEEKECV